MIVYKNMVVVVGDIQVSTLTKLHCIWVNRMLCGCTLASKTLLSGCGVCAMWQCLSNAQALRCNHCWLADDVPDCCGCFCPSTCGSCIYSRLL